MFTYISVRTMSIQLAAALLATHLIQVNSVQAQVVGKPVRVINYSAENFDRLCFRNMVATAAREKAQRMLNAKTAMTDSSVNLNAEQKAQLLLAGEIDIQRFFAAFDEMKSRWKFGSIPQDFFSEQFPKMRTAAMPLMERYQAGLHEKGSLYHKTKVMILAPSDFQAMEVFSQKRKQKLYRNMIRATVAALDARLPLTIQQRETMTETVLDNTEALEPHDYNEMMLFIVLPKFKEAEAQLQPLFSQDEWPIVQRFINLAGLRKR